MTANCRMCEILLRILVREPESSSSLDISTHLEYNVYVLTRSGEDGCNVCQRSARTLSFPTDKFPALSGLAAEYSYLLRDEYVAELWRKNLIRGLCWMILPSQPQASIVEYGPSWSWAKVAGPVTYDLLNTAPNGTQQITHGEVNTLPSHRIASLYLNDGPSSGHRVGTEAEGNDPNGTLKSAFIRIKNQMVPLVFLGRTTWRAGNDVIAITWDMKPDIFKNYFLLDLREEVPAVLVVTPVDAGKRTYARVGIAPMTKTNFKSWFQGSQREDVNLI